MRPTLQVGRTLWAALAFATAPAVAGAQSTSTAPVRQSAILNHAVATFVADGTPDSSRAGATIVVARQAVLASSGSLSVSVAAGQRRILAHAVTNQGTNDDFVRITAAPTATWPLTLYRDADGDARFTAADLPVTGSLLIPRGVTVALFAVVDVPVNAPLGAIDDIVVSAVSGNDPAASVQAPDHVTVVAQPTAQLTIAKRVDRATATIGDTLRYTIAYGNTGDGDAHRVAIADTLPRGLRMLAGTLAANGRALTDAADADSGMVETLADGREVVRLNAGLLAAGAEGTVSFATLVTRTATTGAIANIATISAGDSTRSFSQSAATGALTAVTVATLALTDQLLGSRTVTVGAQAHLRFAYANTSTVDARNTVLVDTLPVQFVAEPTPGAVITAATDAAGARIAQVVTWTLGTLAPGETGVRDLYVRIASRSGDADISDRAHLAADNADTRYARMSANVALYLPTDLHITKAAGVLEAAVGDAVPYAVVLRNAGLATLRGVVVRDRLPDGMNFMPASVSGADSAVVAGADLALFVAPMAPGASVTVRYAAVIATPGAGASLKNRAMAEAEGALVRSDTASALVSLRRVLAMRERTMIGKVWLDRDGDGMQQTGEEGVGGVQVWDANGDLAITDVEGRFSFRNVATGTHALRLDPAGIPRGFVLPTRADEVVAVRADGWTLPNVSIRLVPRAGMSAVAACRCADTLAAPAPATASLVAASVTPAVASPAAQPGAAAPTVAPAMSAAERTVAERRELIEGPGLHVTAPADGAVLATARFYAGVRGAPGAIVGLYDGATLLRSGTLRSDGVQDFLNVELTAGPHRLRVAALDSANPLRADSIALHVSGTPARFVLPASLPALRRDAALPVTARIQVLDRWNVPVANQPMITVLARGAVVAAPDGDASSVGLQLRTDGAGFVDVPLRAGFQVGDGELQLSASGTTARIALQVFASVRPLVVTGVGQVGVGGAPGAFGALTVQGAVTPTTSVAVTYDSRRADAGNDFFQRGFDPLGDEQYPLVGDNSTTRSTAPTTQALAARVEHGMDWLAAGDVQTLDFGRAGDLGAYRRSLTGVAARLGTGALTWHGFGSMTRQSVERTQRRGDGSTGPYAMGSGIRAGTEIVAIEVRARDNAARIVSRQPLTRITDYQVDYVSGAVLLRLPVPSTDGYGNPVFVVATVERLTGGESHFVGGLRLEGDAVRLLGLRAGLFDSLTVGLSGVEDQAATGGLASSGTFGSRALLSGDVRVRRGALALAADVLRSRTADSSGTATSASARWALPGDRIALDGRWMSVGEGMSGADPRLSAAVSELTLGLTAKLGAESRLRLHRADSRFSQYGVSRTTTGLSAEETLQGRVMKQDLSLLNEAGASGIASSALTARVSTSLSSAVETWVDGTRSLSAPVAGIGGGRPNQLGTGVTLKLPAGLKLEASHRVMRTPGDSVSFGVTTAQLRAEGFLGGQVWTGFEESTAGFHDEVRAGHSALLGWNQQIQLGAGWQAVSLYERRIGLSRAPAADPERALPFVQPEADRWSASAGLGWNPGGDRARLSMNAEMQRGQGASGTRFQLAGDAAINAGLAVLALNDWSGRTDLTQGITSESRQDRSLLALAMRPVSSERFNAITKLEWRRTVNPLGSTLLVTSARDLRLIASSDAVYTPRRSTEVSLRYAARATTSDIAGDSAQRLHVADHFAGLRLEHRLVGALHLKADGRLLVETESRTALWNMAPSVLYDLQGRLSLEAGYRFGGLRDPDFAAVGGAGAFATVGVRFTEGSLASPAAFWRERLANDR